MPRWRDLDRVEVIDDRLAFRAPHTCDGEVDRHPGDPGVAALRHSNCASLVNAVRVLHCVSAAAALLVIANVM
jgi:hypothetical protein